MNQTPMNGVSAAPNVLTLSCPTCGSKLKLSSQVHLLVCAHCGNEHMVHRDGGAVFLAPLVQDVQQIRVSTDKTAAELAVVRLTKEIAAIDDELEEAKHRNYSIQVPPLKGEVLYVFGILVMGGASFVSLVAASVVGSWIPLLFTAAFFFALCWTVFVFSSKGAKRNAEVERVKQSELRRLTGIRAAKIASLEKNHAIANG